MSTKKTTRLQWLIVQIKKIAIESLNFKMAHYP